METYNDQLFPPAFLVNYTKEPAGRQRVLTYSLFRFLSCVAEEQPDLAQFLADQVSCPSAEDSFEILEDYLSADDYFSPSIAADGFEPFYLYAAIVLTAGVPFGTTTPVIDSLIEDHAPEAASLPYADGNLPLDALLVDCRNFYAALCLCLMHHTDALAALLPQFLNAYRPEYHFSCESFVLYDFMDEYFEQHDCLHHPSFVQLTDTLVAATLNYYNTDLAHFSRPRSPRTFPEPAPGLQGLSAMAACVCLPSLTQIRHAICSPTCSAMPPFTSCAAICLIFIWMKTA